MENAIRNATAVSIASMVLGSSVFAQEMCSGLASSGQWIGGSEGGSNISIVDDAQEQMALVLGGNQHVSLFSLSETTDVRIEASGRGEGDPVIDLYDASGNILLSDDDSGGDGASRAETTLGSGTYCIALRSYDNAPMTGFVRIGRMEHEPLTTGFDTAATNGGDVTGGGICDANTPASQILIGSAGTGSVQDTPYWRFTVSEAVPISITAENEVADPVITLYDASGNYLAENDDFDGLNSRLDMSSPLAPGDYCIAMSALSDEAQPITVSVSIYDPVAALEAMYARGDAAPPLDGSYPIVDLGVLESRARKDVQNRSEASWFSLEVPEGGILLVEAISPDGNSDPYLYLYDDLGRLIQQNDDFDGLNSQIVARVERGTYLIAIREVDDGAQGFIRMLMERYVPAR